MISDIIIKYDFNNSHCLWLEENTLTTWHISSRFTLMGKVFAQQRMRSRHMQHTIDQFALQFPW